MDEKERHHWATKRLLYGSLAIVTLLLIISLVIMFKPIAEEPPGSLVLEIIPPDNLKVIVDGISEHPGNASPFTLGRLRRGDHTVLIKRLGYESYLIQFRMEKVQMIRKRITLKKLENGEPQKNGTEDISL